MYSQPLLLGPAVFTIAIGVTAQASTTVKVGAVTVGLQPKSALLVAVVLMTGGVVSVQV